MDTAPDLLSPPSNDRSSADGPSPPAPLPRGEGELSFPAEPATEGQRFDLLEFGEFRLGPEVQWLWPGCFGGDGGCTWWTAEQCAERAGRLQALAAGSMDGNAAFQTADAGLGRRGPERDAPADRPSSRLNPGMAWINEDGTVSQAVAISGVELLAQCEARQAARHAETTTTPAPPAVAANSARAPQPATPSPRTPVRPPEKPQEKTQDKTQPGSSKNEESLEKQADFQPPANGPLPRDGYARRQERKRRQREREKTRKR